MRQGSEIRLRWETGIPPARTMDHPAGLCFCCLGFGYIFFKASHVPSTTTLLTYPADHTRRCQPCTIYTLAKWRPHPLQILRASVRLKISASRAPSGPQMSFELPALSLSAALSISFNMLICAKASGGVPTPCPNLGPPAPASQATALLSASLFISRGYH